MAESFLLEAYMKLTSINKKLFELCNFDKELLQNKEARRPYVVIVRLKYGDEKFDFAVPFRSNIPPGTDPTQFFPLPTRSTTKPGHFHGLHFTKMFPISKMYLEKYHQSSNVYDVMIKKTIDRKEKLIVTAAQNYLDDYIKNGPPKYSTDIEGIIDTLSLRKKKTGKETHP